MARKQNRANSFFDFATEPGGDEGKDGEPKGTEPASSPRAGGSPPGGDAATTGRLRLLGGDEGSSQGTESLGGLEPIYGLEPPTPVETPPAGLSGSGGGRPTVRKLSLLDTAHTSVVEPADSAVDRSDRRTAADAPPAQSRIRKLSLLDTAATLTDDDADCKEKDEGSAAAPVRSSSFTGGGALVPMPAETLADDAPASAAEPARTIADQGSKGAGSPLDFHQTEEAGKSAEKRYEELKALADSNPDEVGPLVGLANVCAELRREAEAKTLLRRARELDPDNSYIRRRLRALGDKSESREARASQVLGFLRAAAWYPARSATGRLLWIGASLLAGVSAATVEFQPLVGGALLAVTLVLASGYLHQVVVTAVRGAQRPPPWPEKWQAVIGSKRVLGAFAACFALPAALFAVSLVLGEASAGSTAGGAVEQPVYDLYLASLRRSFQEVDGMAPVAAEKAAEAELVAAGVHPTESGMLRSDGGSMPVAFLGAGVLVLLFGLVYFPMAVAMCCELDNPRIAFNYPHGIGQMVRAAAVYAPIALCSVGVAVVSLAALWSLLLLFPWPVFGAGLAATVTALVSFYLTGALCFLSGRAYPLWEREFS